MKFLLSSLKERCNRSILSSSGIRNGSFVIRNGIGFTLVELMIVIAIIGVLAASLFPMMSGYMDRAKMAAFEKQIREYVNATEIYKADTGGYPEACSTNGVPLCTDDHPFYSYMSDKKTRTTHPFGGAIGWGVYDYNQDGKLDFAIGFDDDRPFMGGTDNQGNIPNNFIHRFDEKNDDGLAHSGRIQGGTGAFAPYTYLRDYEFRYIIEWGE